MFEIIGRYAWVLCIGATVYNFRAMGSPNDISEAKEGVVDEAKLKIIRSRVVAAMIFPWAVMGFSQVFGGVPDVWSFFRARDLNPYVWSWYTSVFLLTCAFAYWVFFRDGVRYAMAMNLIQVEGFRGQLSEKWVKVIAAMGPPFSVAWVSLLWVMDVPA